MTDQYEQAEIMLILKYGSMEQAYQVWWAMSAEEQREMDTIEYEVLIRYEYNKEYGWP